MPIPIIANVPIGIVVRGNFVHNFTRKSSMTLVPWEATGDGTKQTFFSVPEHPCCIVWLTILIRVT